MNVFLPRMTLLAVGLLAWGLGFSPPTAAQPGDPVFQPSRLLNPDAETDSARDASPRIETDGRTWIVGWHSDRTAEGTVGADLDIWLMRSTDGGGTWSNPFPLHANAGGDAGRDFDVQFAVQVLDAQLSVWIAVWHSRDSLGALNKGTDDDIVFARSFDDGATWTEPQLLNDYGTTDSGDDQRARIVTDGEGTFLVVWKSEDEALGTGTEGDIMFSRSTDAGKTWTPAAVVNVGGVADAFSDSRIDDGAELATDGNAWVVVWQSRGTDPSDPLGTDNDILFARSEDDGEHWSAPKQLTDQALTVADDLLPTIATDGEVWIAAWGSNESGLPILEDEDILYVRSTDDGVTWEGPTGPLAGPLNANATEDVGFDRGPRFVKNGNTWLALWFSSDSLNGMIGGDEDILMAFSRDEGHTWSDPELVNRGADDDNDATSDGDTDPEIAADGGAVTAVWRFRGSDGSPGANDIDIRYARGFIPPPGCQNGVKSGDEECDHGNDISDDDCRPDCRLIVCGNGFLDEPGDDHQDDPREQCDDGNAMDGDGCRPIDLGPTLACTKEICGDDFKDPQEECDDGNTICGDSCDPEVCKIPDCGNGHVCADAGEQCDDGNRTKCDGCDADCFKEGCGNGRTECEEECDDGANEVCGTDSCDPNCREHGCGNGYKCSTGLGDESSDPSTREECDDGNVTSGDDCDSNCTRTACGNGVRTGDEQCDDGVILVNDGCFDCHFDCESDLQCPTIRACTPRRCVDTALGGKKCQDLPRNEPCRACNKLSDCDDNDECTVDTCESDEEGCKWKPKEGREAILCKFQPLDVGDCSGKVVAQVDAAIPAAEELVKEAMSLCANVTAQPKPVAKRVRKATGLLNGAIRKLFRAVSDHKISKTCSDELTDQVQVPLGKLQGLGTPAQFCAAILD